MELNAGQVPHVNNSLEAIEIFFYRTSLCVQWTERASNVVDLMRIGTKETLLRIRKRQFIESDLENLALTGYIERKRTK